jgi:hypothetical protein
MKLTYMVAVEIETQGSKVSPRQREAMGKYLKKLMLDDPDWEHSPMPLKKVTVQSVAEDDDMLLREVMAPYDILRQFGK